MTDLFTSVLNLSITGSVVILFVLAARPLLQKFPKIFSYVLWLVVLFRLLCPVTIQLSALAPAMFDPEALLDQWTGTSVEETVRFYSGTQEYAQALAQGQAARIQVEGEDSYILSASDDLSAPDTVQTRVVPVLAVIWLAGMGAISLYGVASVVCLRLRLRAALHLRDNIYLVDHIDAPFVMGLVHPRIYLPSDLAAGERCYILAHERHHIRRGDHIVKLLNFAAVSIHWFNPLIWLAGQLLTRDMEMSCDEAVLRRLGAEIRSDYSQSLLNLSTGRRWLAWTPLAFGEGSTGSRIRNVLRWKKPTVLTLILALVLTTALSVCALTESAGDAAEPGVAPGYMLHNGDLRPLNQSQTAALEGTLEQVPYTDVRKNPYDDLQSLFTVGIRWEHTDYNLCYGYRQGSVCVTISRPGTDINYIIENEALKSLLYHFFISGGAIDMASDQLPEDAVSRHGSHVEGCEVRFYDYRCPVCAQEETAVVSRMCSCTACKAYWRTEAQEIIGHHPYK